MSLRQIKAAVNKLKKVGSLTKQGSARASGRLYLVVPLKRKVVDQSEVLQELTQELIQEQREPNKVKNWVPCVLTPAEGYNSKPTFGIFALMGDNDYVNTLAEISVYPNDLLWDEALIIDDKGELFPLDRLEEATDAILGNEPPKGRGILFYDPENFLP